MNEANDTVRTLHFFNREKVKYFATSPEKFPFLWNRHVSGLDVDVRRRTDDSKSLLDSGRSQVRLNGNNMNVKQDGDNKACASQPRVSLRKRLMSEPCLIFHEAGCRSEPRAQSVCSAARWDQKEPAFLISAPNNLCLRLRHVDTTHARCNGIDLHHQSAPVSPTDTSIISADAGQRCTDCKTQQIVNKVGRLQQLDETCGISGCLISCCKLLPLFLIS